MISSQRARVKEKATIDGDLEGRTLSGRLQRESLSAQVARELADLVETRSLGPGELLPSENWLAENFGVSRSVIREALKSLAGQGVVDIVNGKGTIVRPLDGNSLDLFFKRAIRVEREALVQLMELRKLLEVQSAGLAAERRTTGEVERMGRIVGAMQGCLEDPECYAELDVEFHLLLAEATRNRMMYYLIGSVRQSLKNAVLEGLRSRHTARQIQRVQELHEEIFAEIKRGDASAAEGAMAAHFDDAVMALVRNEKDARPGE